MYTTLTLVLILLATVIFNLWYQNWLKSQKNKRDNLQAKLEVLKVATKHECLKTMQGEPAKTQNWVLSLLKLMDLSNPDTPPIALEDGHILCTDKEGQRILVGYQLWEPQQETPVQRGDLQKLVGAMIGQKLQRGMYISTAHFSKEAQDYIASLPKEFNLETMDGETLMNNLHQLRQVHLEPLLST